MPVYEIIKQIKRCLGRNEYAYVASDVMTAWEQKVIEQHTGLHSAFEWPGSRYIFSKKEIVKKYPNTEPLFIVETTYGCYSDYGWTFCQGFNDEEEAIKSCKHWNKTGGNHRVINSRLREIIYS